MKSDYIKLLVPVRFGSIVHPPGKVVQVGEGSTGQYISAGQAVLCDRAGNEIINAADLIKEPVKRKRKRKSSITTNF